jgi:hypothetical protein
LSTELKTRGIDLVNLYSFRGNVGLFVDKDARSTTDILGALSTDAALSTKARNSIFGVEGGQRSYTVEPNGVGHSFASCTDAKRRYATQTLDWGVKRVWLGSTPSPYNRGSSAWIIDSGIGTGFHSGTDTELNILSRRDCTKALCPTDTQKTDIVGHGTMIAGIIGAIDNKVGVVGVAPGANLHSLRVVAGSTGEFNLDSLVNALYWLRINNKTDSDPSTPSPGDVINLSLGSPWVSAQLETHEVISNALRELADLGYKVSIAAGNSDVLNGLGYVSAISPARMGGYRTSGDGLIAAVSATDERDWFWQTSAFGNFYTTVDQHGFSQYQSLPDFAEPGVNVISLWPGPDVAKCTGTSVAAAHLSGILLWGTPSTDKFALYDRSAEMPDKKTHTPGNNGDYDHNFYDPIGVHRP